MLFACHPIYQTIAIARFVDINELAELRLFRTKLGKVDSVVLFIRQPIMSLERGQ